MKIWKVLLMVLPLAGCVTDQDMAYLTSNFYSRADVDAINAGNQCRRMARNLLQVARCDGVKR